ncbi:sigma factor-like helix-turn-helix DNA-binding protein [Nocardioides sp.]|uniref:sigma factor-like helix-turn-helix DNA-binding protein n=1 Tax=Nocardioides sp. TaxID=35761 RepID=UPI002EDB1D1D
MGEIVGGPAPSIAEDQTAAHLSLVEHVVTETLQRVPSSVTREELTAAGLAALATASWEYLPAADGDFHRYAAARVRAALVDLLRSIDWEVRGRTAPPTPDHGRRELVRAAVAALPAERRAVVEGYFLDQRSLPELADDLDLDVSEVARLRTAALRALRRTVGPALAVEAQPRLPHAQSGSSGTGSPRTLNLR